MLRNKLHRVVDAGKVLCGVEYERRARTKKLRAFSRNDCTVLKLYGRAVMTAFPGTLTGGCNRFAVDCRLNFCLIEKQSYFIYFRLIAYAYGKLIESREITSDNLVVRRHAAHFVIAYAEANHVHAHIGRRFIGVLAVNALEECIEHRENLYIAVVIDCGLAVSFQVEGVYHVYVIEVGRSCLIGDIDRMLQRKTPHGECFELRIAGTHAATVFVVELAETDCHLAAARAGGRHDYKRTGRGHIFIATKALVAVDKLNVVGISVD